MLNSQAKLAQTKGYSKPALAKLKNKCPMDQGNKDKMYFTVKFIYTLNLSQSNFQQTCKKTEKHILNTCKNAKN